MHVGDILEKQDLLTFPETATAMQAARGMTERKVGAVLVIAADGSLTGIFTERDLMARVVVEKRDLESTQLKDVMTRDLYQVGPEEEIARVRTELQRRHIRHLPIVANGKLLGVLSLRDILRADLDKMSHEVEELENYFLGGTDPPA